VLRQNEDTGTRSSFSAGQVVTCEKLQYGNDSSKNPPLVSTNLFFYTTLTMFETQSTTSMIKSQGKNGQRRETIVHFEEKDGDIKTKI
jgi:hypothetical protein